ncbi:hypothetical protein AAHB33_16410 [Paenarthrobacter sp. S56]|uniref:hypothetical protein n=1 Tax=Paenarthrobacter sp. S56 TaxID=3138179 RepID=UPI00321AC486
MRHFLFELRDHVPAELDGIRDEVVAPQAKDPEAQLVVVEDRLGDGVVAAYQRRRASSPAACGLGEGRP